MPWRRPSWGSTRRQVGYLAHAESAGLGVADLDAIQVVGDPIDAVRRRFVPHSNHAVQRHWGRLTGAMRPRPACRPGAGTNGCMSIEAEVTSAFSNARQEASDLPRERGMDAGNASKEQGLLVVGVGWLGTRRAAAAMAARGDAAGRGVRHRRSRRADGRRPRGSACPRPRLAAALDWPGVDAVVVATPHADHARPRPPRPGGRQARPLREAADDRPPRRPPPRRARRGAAAPAGHRASTTASIRPSPMRWRWSPPARSAGSRASAPRSATAPVPSSWRPGIPTRPAPAAAP